MNGATARVMVTIEIGPFGTWGDDCSVGQVKDQAAGDAEGHLRELMAHANKMLGEQYRIIGKPVVTVIMVGQGTNP